MHIIQYRVSHVCGDLSPTPTLVDAILPLIESELQKVIYLDNDIVNPFEISLTFLDTINLHVMNGSTKRSKECNTLVSCIN